MQYSWLALITPGLTSRKKHLSSCSVSYHLRIDAPIVRFIVIHCSNVIPLYFVLAVCGAIYFATDFIIFSFSFIRIYMCMCVFYFKRQTQWNNASLFSTRKKEKRENEERSENWRGMKKTSGTRVYALFLDNSGFY